MDENEIWTAIDHVVRSGKETPTIELREPLYDFHNDVLKGEFIKDVCGIANILPGQGTAGYVVIGIAEVDKCPDRTESCVYLSSFCVPRRDELERTMNQILESHVDPAITVECHLLHPDLTGLTSEILVTLICGWTQLQVVDPRPYVIVKDVGKLRRGVIYLRQGTRTVPALRADIINLFMKNVQSDYLQQIKSLQQEIGLLQSGYEEQVSRLRAEHENEVLELKAKEHIEYTKLEDDRDWFQEQTKNLHSESIRRLIEAMDWRVFALTVCNEFYRALPEKIRESKMSRLLARCKKEEYYKEIVHG